MGNRARLLREGDAGRSRRRAYQLSAKRVRFQAGMARVDAGQKLRSAGQLEEAMAEFQKAYAIDPSNSMAEQELKRTKDMIEREKNPQGHAAATPEERGLTPAERAQKNIDEKMSRMMSAPELKPINPQLTTLKMNNQPVRVLYETVGKLAGINVVFDPEYQAPPGKVELHHRSLEHHPRRSARLHRHSDQVLLETALLEYDFRHQRQRYEAPRL